MAAAEMAILLPFVGFLFVVAIDFCRAYYAAQIVESCAHVAALHAGGHCTWNHSPDNEDGGLLGIPGLLDELLNGVDPAAQDFADYVAAARLAAIAEGQSLQPPLRAQDVEVDYQSDRVIVTVRYRFRMATPLLGRERVMVRSVHMPVMPQPTGSPSPLAALLRKLL